MPLRSTEERILHSSKCEERGVITLTELCNIAIVRIADDEECDPVGILKLLPVNQQVAIIETVRTLATQGYRLPMDERDFNDEHFMHEQGEEERAQLQRVGEQILAYANGL